MSNYVTSAKWGKEIFEGCMIRSQVVREKVINGTTYTIYNHESIDIETGKMYKHFLVYTGKPCYDSKGRKYWWNKEEMFLGMYDTMGQATKRMKKAIANDMYL